MKGGGNNGGGGGVIGIGEDDHEIEIRIDHELVQRWNVGGEFPGPDPGILIPIPEDDVEGIRLHEYRLNADRGLEVRVPIEAGQRLVTVAFTDSNPTPFAGAYGRPGIDRLFNLRAVRRQGAGRHAKPPADLHLPAGRRGSRGRGALRPRDPHEPGAAGVPAARHGGRPGAAPRFLPRRPGRARLRRRHRAGPRSLALDAGVPAAHRTPAAGRRARGGVPDQRPGVGVAAVVLPVAQHPR